jgi:hypothetical protein
MKALKVILAVLLCVLTFAGCKAETDFEVEQAGNDITVNDEKPVKTEKSDNKDDKNNNTTEAADTGSAESDSTETPASATPMPFPENTIAYGLSSFVTTFINGDTGEVVLTVDEKTDKYTTDEFEFDDYVGMEYNFAKYRLENKEHRYVDSTGNIFDLSDSALLEYFPTMPADASKDYPYVQNGVYIATADEKFYGLKSENGDVLVDAIYSLIKPNKDFTYFICSLNGNNNIVSATGETMFIINSRIDEIKFDLYPGFVYAYGTGHGLYNLSTGEKIFETSIYQALPESRFLTSNGVFDENGDVLFDKDTFKTDEYYVTEINKIGELSPYLYCELWNYYRDYFRFIIDYDGNIINIDEEWYNYRGTPKIRYQSDHLFVLYSDLVYIYDSTMKLINSFVPVDNISYEPFCDYLLKAQATLSNYNGEIVAEYSEISDIINDNTVCYSDKNTGLWGVIQNGEIVIEPQYTKISGSEVLKLERGAEVTYMLTDNLIEIDMPAV